MNQPKNEPVVIIARITPYTKPWGRVQSVRVASDGTPECEKFELEPVVPRED